MIGRLASLHFYLRIVWRIGHRLPVPIGPDTSLLSIVLFEFNLLFQRIVLVKFDFFIEKWKSFSYSLKEERRDEYLF